MSKALIEAMSEHKDLDVIVVADCSAHARRLGYGVQSSFASLIQRGVTIYQLSHIRLSACIVDEVGWAFALPPMLVEDPNSQHGLNGIALHEEQVEQIAQQMALMAKSSESKQPPSHGTDDALQPIQLTAAKPLSNKQLDTIEQDLELNPPQKFDVSRQVNVFNSRIEFVELELEGGHVDRHTFKFPKEIKQLLSNDEEAQDRLSANYKLIGAGSKASSKPLVDQVERLRRTFLKPMGKLGRVILRAQKENYEKGLADTRALIGRYKQSLKADLTKEIDKSKTNLIRALADRVKANPPDDLRYGIEGKRVTKKDAERYLDNLLGRYMPTPDQLIADIKLHSHYKAVTYEMLDNPEFQKQLQLQFPNVEWDRPMDEYTAVKASERGV
ncbi:unnamed protein product [Ectocarpus sp. 12 AP-2014]